MRNDRMAVGYLEDARVKAFPEKKFVQRVLFWLTDKKLTDFLLLLSASLISVS